MKNWSRYLLIGILSVVPLLVVVQVVFWVQSFSLSFFDFLSKYTNNSLYTIFIIVFSLIFLVILGYFIEKSGRFFILSWIENILNKIPAVRTIYSVAKKITDMFMQNGDGSKKEVVLVEYPKVDIWVPAYVLNRHEDTLVLFVPTSPNPTSGYSIIVNKKYVLPTSLTLEEASRFIMSMGSDYVKKEEIARVIREKSTKV